MRAGVMFVALVLAGASAAGAAISDKETRRIQDAARVLEESSSIPDKTIPRDVLDRARCIAVVPGLKKGAFIVGGEYGKGVVSCRTSRGWSAPAFLTLEKGSWGAQIGAESIDLVLLFMNQNGIDRLLQDHVTLGADASIAAGPLGRNGTAATDGRLTAEILSYSRARGLFAGIDLSGGVMRPDDGADKDLYGTGVTPRAILLEGRVRPPSVVRPFTAALKAMSPVAQPRRSTTAR